MRSGITLGNYIIVNNIKHLRHELGHTRQSKILGPLYLLVIGLPSLIHAGLHAKVCKEGENGKHKGKYKNFKWKYF